MSDINARMKKLVSEQLGVEVGGISDDASFTDDLGADSLDLVELIMAIEEEFAIEITDTDAEKIQTLGQAVAYVSANAA